MSETPFIKFYPSDFLGGTSGLSPAERGVYITLLCLIFENNGPIPRDDARLSRRCGAPRAAFKRLLDALIGEGKIAETDGMLSNRRAEKALADRVNRTQNATHAADQRWAAQREKIQQKQDPDNADAMPPQCAVDASQKPEPDKREDTKVSSGRSASPDEGFGDFWSIWPSKKNKDAARRAWRKLSIEGRRAAYQAVRQGWFERWQAATSPDVNPIHASTFLNRRRWEDEVSTPKLKAIEGDRGNGRPGSAKNSQERREDRAERQRRIIGVAARGTTDTDWG